MTADQSLRSPWLMVWLSPRQTIEHLVAKQPTHFVWLLAVFGTVASLYNQITVVAGTAYLFGWQLALSLVLFGALVGTIWLYLAGLTLSWIGGLLGGAAPALHMRAVFAWSTLPTILGFAAVLLIEVTHAITPDVVPLLVAATSLWSLIVFLLMLGRVERFGIWRTILTYLLNLVLGLAIALVIRSFLYQPFNIPAASMRPTLLVGDDILVSKFAYGYSRYSLPYSRFLPAGRVFASEPARGDVVVFRRPKDTATDYVKRVVGLPGDRVQLKQGVLFINGTPVKRERLADAGDAREVCGSDFKGNVKRWRETLPNGISYETLDCVDNGSLDNTDVYAVPDEHFFVLGDNRDNSIDSRVLSTVGYIPFQNLIGRVSLIFFSREDGDGKPARVRAHRIGRVVR
jgi:signal peptidase I